MGILETKTRIGCWVHV